MGALDPEFILDDFENNFSFAIFVYGVFLIPREARLVGFSFS